MSYAGYSKQDNVPIKLALSTDGTTWDYYDATAYWYQTGNGYCRFTQLSCPDLNFGGGELRFINTQGSGSEFLSCGGQQLLNPSNVPYVYAKGGFAPTVTTYHPIDARFIPVSGVNDGTNWTSLTIGSDTYAIPQGGSSVTWGNITGTLSNQTDLNAALTDKLDASKCTYQTTEPASAIADGGVHIVYLSAEPSAKYSGYIYMIAEA